jgi:hypothetical protein
VVAARYTLRAVAFRGLQAPPAPDIIGQDPAAIASSAFSYFNIRYLMLHSEGGALRYNTLLRVAQSAAGGVDPERVTLPGRSYWLYRVAPPAKALPFVGIGSGWSEPQARPDRSVRRQIQGEAELLLYSAASLDVSIRFLVHSRGTGRLQLTVDGQSFELENLGPGGQHLEVPLRIEAGVTSLMLRPEGAGDMWVERVDLLTR